MTTVTAMFAYRYEPDWLIDQLRENLAWVDNIVHLNTRSDSRTWVPAVERANRLRHLALEARAQWLLYVAPDERLERNAEQTIRAAIEGADYRTSFKLRCREMYTPTAYRVDGVWGGKNRIRLYHIRRDGKAKRKVQLDVNLYHLAHIEPENRGMRRRVFEDHNTWDNKSRGFAYLTDETGLQLEEIPPGREYDPPYRQYLKSVPGY